MTGDEQVGADGAGGADGRSDGRSDGWDQRVGPADVVRRAFEEQPVALMSVEGPEHRFVAANAAYRAIAGRALVVGHTVRELFPEVLGQQLFEWMDRCYASGVPEVAREWRVQLDDVDGEPREMFLTLNLAPYQDETGAVAGMHAMVTDSTTAVLARRAAEAATAAAERRLADAVDIVVALQQALLPRALPVLPGVETAARYLFAGDETAAGGDWFDAVTSPDGTVALVVGDVVGHRLAAAGVMGQLRAVLHERLLSGASVVEALEGLDRFAGSVQGSHAATVCVAQFDSRTGVVEYCTAGHPPPLVITAGQAGFLETTGSGPLATGTSFRAATVRLEPGDLLLLYSDGLVERPGRTAGQNTVELAQVAADAYAARGLAHGAPTRATDRVCQLVLELLTRETGYSDDITLLAAQRVVDVPPLELRLPADVPAVRTIRELVSEWLTRVGAESVDRVGLHHAIDELVTNVVQHAYPDAGTGDVRVRLELGRTAQP